MMRTAAFTALSNGIKETDREQIEKLVLKLEDMGLKVRMGNCIYAAGGIMSGTARERAQSLMDAFEDPETEMIFDISGGDLAGEVIPYLDPERIRACRKPFYGYSDLTCVINVLAGKADIPCGLFQIRSLLWDETGGQEEKIREMLLGNESKIRSFDYRFIQGERLSGITAGGNIRCLLKLAGTDLWPELNGRVLVLESRSGDYARISAYFNHLGMMGVYRQVSGLLLGTFTQLEKEEGTAVLTDLIKRFVPEDVPVVKTSGFGHGADMALVPVGEMITLEKKESLFRG